MNRCIGIQAQRNPDEVLMPPLAKQALVTNRNLAISLYDSELVRISVLLKRIDKQNQQYSETIDDYSKLNQDVMRFLAIVTQYQSDLSNPEGTHQLDYEDKKIIDAFSARYGLNFYTSGSLSLSTVSAWQGKAQQLGKACQDQISALQFRSQAALQLGQQALSVLSNLISMLNQAQSQASNWV